MNESRHPIDDLFNEGLGNFSEPAPMHVWERIDRKRTPVYKLVNNFRQNYRWYLSVVAGLAIMSSAALLILSQDEQEKGLAKVHAGTRQQPSSYSAPEVATSDGSGTVSTSPERASIEKTYLSGNIISASKKNQGNRQIQSSANSTPSANSEISSPSGNQDITPVVTEHGNTSILSPSMPLSNEAVPSSPEQAPEESLLPEVALNEAAPVLSENAASNGDFPTEKDRLDDPAKKDEKKTKLPSRWSVDLMGSYNLVGKKISGAPTYLGARKDAENITGAFSLQARTSYQHNDVFGISLGIQYSRINENFLFKQPFHYEEIQNRMVTGYILDPINGPTAITYPVKDTVTITDYKEVRSQNRYTFIDIPVQVHYTFLNKDRFSLGLNAGAAVNLRFSQLGRTLNSDASEVLDMSGNGNPFRVNAGVNVLLGAQATWKMSEQLHLLFEPAYRLGTSSILRSDFAARQQFNTLQMNVGMRFKF